ncbi:MAG: DUF2059 domain-containing protein [Flavobacterium sp.]|jgi:hypothetical protein|nr:DUF2059 domain-containing protein [Flavobacterium sp.]
MKKMILTFAFFVATNFVMAQDAFKADVVKAIEMSGANSSMDAVKKQVLGMIPESKQAEFLKEFDVVINSINEEQVKNFMEVYTHDDIKEMIKFYSTPTGKKIKEKAGVLAEKNMAMQQTIGMQMQGILMKYMQ